MLDEGRSDRSGSLFKAKGTRYGVPPGRQGRHLYRSRSHCSGRGRLMQDRPAGSPSNDLGTGPLQENGGYRAASGRGPGRQIDIYREAKPSLPSPIVSGSVAFSPLSISSVDNLQAAFQPWACLAAYRVGVGPSSLLDAPILAASFGGITSGAYPSSASHVLLCALPGSRSASLRLVSLVCNSSSPRFARYGTHPALACFLS